MSRAHHHDHRHRTVRTLFLALVCAWGIGAASPGYAFWGLLGKAGKAAAAAGKAAEVGGEAAGVASKAGKAAKAAEAADAARAAGKTAAVGAVAAGGTELTAAATKRGITFAADDAAHLTGKAPLMASDTAMMAATPPEVARYLTRPAQALSNADSTQMLSLYQQMMRQAGKTGDFTSVERMPSLHASKQLETHTAQATTATTAVSKGQLPSAELSFHALRLLSHAANSSHNSGALRELQSYCKNKPPATWQVEHADLCGNVPQPR
ncbi:MAG: hypothetical protein LBE30_03515 [Comamonas sp.]|jgi:hypothetical protein|nr:hypothetical protein [Comamonas sp.]